MNVTIHVKPAGRDPAFARGYGGQVVHRMPEPELSLLFVRPLNELGVRYMVSGSVAATLYGEPRLTHDVDFVVWLRQEDIPRLRQVFPLPEFYVFKVHD